MATEDFTRDDKLGTYPKQSFKKNDILVITEYRILKLQMEQDGTKTIFLDRPSREQIKRQVNWGAIGININDETESDEQKIAPMERLSKLSFPFEMKPNVCMNELLDLKNKYHNYITVELGGSRKKKKNRKSKRGKKRKTGKGSRKRRK